MSITILDKTYKTDEEELILCIDSLDKHANFLGKFTNLKFLLIDCKEPSTFITEFDNLFTLEYLLYFSNGLALLPESIGKLARLEALYLHNNALTELPESIGNLVRLKELHLDNNRLTTLPSSLSKLVNLQVLKLQKNNLISIPAELEKLKIVMKIDDSSYQIDNLSLDGEILIFSKLNKELTNIPSGIKKIYIREGKEYIKKIPFGCKIMTF
jgi:Leucine-rich repeat (LRR) protein